MLQKRFAFTNGCGLHFESRIVSSSAVIGAKNKESLVSERTKIVTGRSKRTEEETHAI